MNNEDSDKRNQIEKYKELLRFPSISAQHKSIKETAQFLRDLLLENNVDARILETDSHPVVYGHYDAGKNKTLLVYNHYDVQPVDPLNEWKHDPFGAEIAGNRIYARGSSDNKGTLMSRIFGILKAIDKGELNVNLKFLYEGEEEI